MIKTEDKQQLYFRFYDPRVFTTYIASAPPEQAAEWFDGVSAYAVEGEAGTTHYFRWRRNQLHDGETPIGAPPN